MDQNGAVLNSYKYDIFGKLADCSEQVRNIFKYSGLLGVIQDEELRDIYMIRARHYDAQHGRFISLDPFGEAFNLILPSFCEPKNLLVTTPFIVVIIK